jgi:hypothetical protein
MRSSHQRNQGSAKRGLLPLRWVKPACLQLDFVDAASRVSQARILNDRADLRARWHARTYLLRT